MTVEHKGYVLQQSDYNNHYMVFKDGRWVCHASCTKKLTGEEAREHIERFIELTRGGID